MGWVVTLLQTMGFPGFSSYVIKRGKILFNSYFLSVGYIGYLSVFFGYNPTAYFRQSLVE